MTIHDWIFPAFLALFSWGISMLLPKWATQYMHPFDYSVYHVSFSVFYALIVLSFIGLNIQFHFESAVIGMLSGFFASLGGLLYYFAIKKYPVGICAVITSKYPIIAALLSFFILHEILTPRQICGIVLGFISLTLLVVARDKKTAE